MTKKIPKTKSSFKYKRVKRYHKYYTSVYRNGKFLKFIKWSPKHPLKKTKIIHKKEVKDVETPISEKIIQQQKKLAKQKRIALIQAEIKKAKARGLRAPRGFVFRSVVEIAYKTYDKDKKKNVKKEFLTLDSPSYEGISDILEDKLTGYGNAGKLIDKYILREVERKLITFDEILEEYKVEPQTAQRGEYVQHLGKAHFEDPTFKKQPIKKLNKKKQKRLPTDRRSIKKRLKVSWR